VRARAGGSARGAFGPPLATTPPVDKVDNRNVVNINVVNQDCGQSQRGQSGPWSISTVVNRNVVNINVVNIIVVNINVVKWDAPVCRRRGLPTTSAVKRF